jgi:hypothetical protein
LEAPQPWKQSAKRLLLEVLSNKGHPQSPTPRIELPPSLALPSEPRAQTAAQKPPQPSTPEKAQNPLPLRNDAILSRIVDGQCDATRLQQAVDMVRLMKHLTAKKRNDNALVWSIDISYTKLGLVGPFVPTSFDADGRPTRDSKEPQATLFWPDASECGVEDLAQRSLALTYAAPACFLRRPSSFQVRRLTARHCDLTDFDAFALAGVLRRKTSPDHLCTLEQIDLAFNYITDYGADALKKAVKYNTYVKTIVLEGNPITNHDGVLDELKRRLENNEKGMPNRSYFSRLLS